MAIQQLTILFGKENYTLNIPVNENTQYKLIDGHKVLTLVVKDKPDNAELENAQKQFSWMAESA